MKIILDAMGGDYAPVEIVKGAVEAAKDGNYKLILVGDEQKIAQELKMNVVSFEECLKSGKNKELIKKSYDSAVSAGVQSTPTVFINSQKVQGALPYASFKELIEKELRS